MKYLQKGSFDFLPTGKDGDPAYCSRGHWFTGKEGKRVCHHCGTPEPANDFVFISCVMRDPYEFPTPVNLGGHPSLGTAREVNIISQYEPEHETDGD